MKVQTRMTMVPIGHSCIRHSFGFLVWTLVINTMRWFISIRYLRTHLRQTLVCIAGVTISVLMFITMDSMMQGFTDKFIIETVESSGHLTVHDEPRETETKILQQVYKDPNAMLVVEGVKPREQIKKIKNPTGLIATIRRMPHVVAATSVVTGDAVISY